VARLAIGLPTVIKIGWSPGIGGVTGGTLPREMVGWLVLIMARLTVGQPAVIEISRPPGIRRVAANIVQHSDYPACRGRDKPGTPSPRLLHG